MDADSFAIDAAVRAAAFRFLEEQVALLVEVSPRTLRRFLAERFELFNRAG